MIQHHAGQILVGTEPLTAADEDWLLGILTDEITGAFRHGIVPVAQQRAATELFLARMDRKRWAAEKIGGQP